MKKFFKFTAAALMLGLAASFASCSDEEDEDDVEVLADGQNNETDVLSSIVGVRFGTGVSGKAIFRYYTILDGNKIKYEQTKFGNRVAGVTWDYEKVENDDGTITLKVSNGVADVEGTNFGSEDITYDFSSGDDTPTVTATYYEGTTPKESTSVLARVYSGIENIIGNTYIYQVSGKSISLSYAFGKDGVAVYKNIKYGNNYADEKYKYQISAWNVLTDDVVLADDGETELLTFSKTSYATELNTYAVHFTQAETGSHTVAAVDYASGSYAATEQTVETTEDEEAGYILITLKGDIASDGSGTFTITTCEENEDGTALTEVTNSSSGTSSSDYTLYTD